MTQRPTLTFLHGFMGDPSDWDDVRRALAEYDVHAPLIRSASDWNVGVQTLIEEIPKRSVIVGYSMGARLALAISLQRPDVCAGLVFVSGNPGLTSDDAREKRDVADRQLADRIERERREDFLQYWYTQSTVFRSLTDRVREDEIKRKAARSGDDWSAVLRTYTVAKQPNFWPRLSELTMPTLAIAGMHDHKYRHIIVRMGAYANVDTRIVAACGHIVHREQPHVFLELLKRYLTAWD